MRARPYYCCFIALVTAFWAQPAQAAGKETKQRAAKARPAPVIKELIVPGIEPRIRVQREGHGTILVEVPGSLHAFSALPQITRHARAIAVGLQGTNIHVTGTAGPSVTARIVVSTGRGVVVQPEPGADIGDAAEAVTWFARALGKRVSLDSTFLSRGFIRALPNGERVAVSGKVRP
jgi:hypothetical protein